MLLIFMQSLVCHYRYCNITGICTMCDTNSHVSFPLVMVSVLETDCDFHHHHSSVLADQCHFVIKITQILWLTRLEYCVMLKIICVSN